MSDALYWTARVALVCAWLVVTLRAYARRHSRPVLWRGCALAALVFASMCAVPWHFFVLEAVRASLKAAGVYKKRRVFKRVLAGALALAAVVGVWSLRKLEREPRALLCCVGLGLQGILISIEMMSLDPMVPKWLVLQPGRYLAEGCFAACALWALRADGLRGGGGRGDRSRPERTLVATSAASTID